MALGTPTNKIDFVDGVSSTSDTTGSFTPTAGALLLLGIHARVPSGSTQPTISSITDSRGWTWTIVHATNGFVDYDASGTDRQSAWLYYLIAPAATAGTVQVTFGVACTPTGIYIDEITGADSGTPIGQSVKNTSNAAGSITATLSSAASTSLLYGFCATQNNNTATYSAEAGWTRLFQHAASGTVFSGETVYKSGNSDLSCTCSWSAGTNRGGLIVVEIVAGGISGTLSSTLDAMTLAGDSDLLIQATLSKTLDAVTLTSDSDLLIAGILSKTLDDVTLASDSDLLIAGTLASTLGDVTLSATGGAEAPITGTLAATLDDATLTSDSDLLIRATLSSTLDAVTVSSTGVLSIAGTLASTLDAATLAATGILPISAALTATLDDATVSASGVLPIVGTGNTTLDALILSGAAGLLIQGQSSVTLADVTLAGEGAALTEIIGQLAVTLDAATLSALATLIGRGNLSLSNAARDGLSLASAVLNAGSIAQSSAGATASQVPVGAVAISNASTGNLVVENS